jgi:hypothetical protein
MGVLSSSVAHADSPTSTIVLRTILNPSTSKITNTIGNTQYGALLYTGVADWQGQTVQLERMLNFRYTNGDGPAGGFLTLTWPDGSQIAMEGGGFVNSSTDLSEVFVSFRVFGASGRWQGYQGIGRQDCTRRGGVESKASCTYVVKVHPG